VSLDFRYALKREPPIELDCAGLDARDQLAAELGSIGYRIEARIRNDEMPRR
jgi:hypothetical protein